METQPLEDPHNAAQLLLCAPVSPPMLLSTHRVCPH